MHRGRGELSDSRALRSSRSVACSDGFWSGNAKRASRVKFAQEPGLRLVTLEWEATTRYRAPTAQRASRLRAHACRRNVEHANLHVGSDALQRGGGGGVGAQGAIGRVVGAAGAGRGGRDRTDHEHGAGDGNGAAGDETAEGLGSHGRFLLGPAMEAT